MHDLVFNNSQEKDNFEQAKKILKKTLKLCKVSGGIGITTDQNNNVLSYEFVINWSKTTINFGVCLTSFEVLEKTKLYYGLVKDSLVSKTDIYHNCALKAASNPTYRPLLLDLQVFSEQVKHMQESKNQHQNYTIH